MTDDFVHINNGLIFTNDGYFPLLEFRKGNVDKWFMIRHSDDDDDDTNRLEGPIHVVHSNDDTNDTYISIDDERYPEINKMKIEAISNDPENLITDIPSWIMMSLKFDTVDTSY